MGCVKSVVFFDIVICLSVAFVPVLESPAVSFYVAWLRLCSSLRLGAGCAVLSVFE